MKKRLLSISNNYKDRNYRPINYSSEFFGYIEHFKYARIILSLFIFVIYFSIGMEGRGTHLINKSINDLIVIGIFFSFIAYSAVFNFARAMFCIQHKVFPLYFGDVDLANGFFKFDYLEWEKKEKSKTSYYLTLCYDWVMFIGIMCLIIIVSYNMLR